MPKPVVVAMQGIAFPLSIELALASDIVVAADDVRFRQLEIGRGICRSGCDAAGHRTTRLGQRDAFPADRRGVRRRGRLPHRAGAGGGPRQDNSSSGRWNSADHRRAGAAGCAGETLANARIARDFGEAGRARTPQRGARPDHGLEDAAEGVRSFLERRPAKFTGM